MTEFEQALYHLLATLPQGKLISYGQLAKQCGYQNHARQVGKILSKLPKDTTLPWFRVINSQGKISLSGNDFLTQKKHLEAEGITVNAKGKIVNFRIYLN